MNRSFFFQHAYCRTLPFRGAQILASLILFSPGGCQAQQTPTRPQSKPVVPTDTTTVSGTQMELPAFSTQNQLITRTGYTLDYAPAYGQAKWVAYVLHGRQFQKEHYARSNQFKSDPKAKPHSADDEDYEGAGGRHVVVSAHDARVVLLFQHQPADTCF